MYKNRSVTTISYLYSTGNPSQRSVENEKEIQERGDGCVCLGDALAVQQKLTQHCKASVVGGLVTKSCPTLATPWTAACQAPLSMGVSRQEHWSRLPFPSIL